MHVFWNEREIALIKVVVRGNEYSIDFYSNIYRTRDPAVAKAIKKYIKGNPGCGIKLRSEPQ